MGIFWHVIDYLDHKNGNQISYYWYYGQNNTGILVSVDVAVMCSIDMTNACLFRVCEHVCDLTYQVVLDYVLVYSKAVADSVMSLKP